MTSTTATATATYELNGPRVAQDIAEAIVEAIKAGADVIVNGVEIYAPWGAHNAANVWQNGSLSVTARTAARTPGRTRDLWFKAGATVTVEVVR